MKLSELLAQLQELAVLAGEEGVDPEIRLGALPNFPVNCTIVDRAVSTLRPDDRISLESVGGEHVIFLGEGKEDGYLFGPVRRALWGD